MASFIYMLTVKNNALCFTSYETLRSANRLIVSSGAVKRSEYGDYVGYELDSRNRMHTHTLFTVPNRLSEKSVGKRLSKLVGLHVHLRHIRKRDYDIAYDYIRKEKRDPLVLENISRKHHGVPVITEDSTGDISIRHTGKPVSSYDQDFFRTCIEPCSDDDAWLSEHLAIRKLFDRRPRERSSPVV